MSPCCLFLPAYIYMKKKVALEQQDSCILCCCCCQCYYTTPITTAVCDSFVFFFHTCIYVIKRAGLVMVFGKKKKNLVFFSPYSFLFFLAVSLSLSPSLSIVFDWCDIWRRRPISLFFLLSVGFYLFAKKAYSQRIVIRRRQKEKERDKIITYTIGTSEAALLLHQNKTTDEKRREENEDEREGGTSGEIIFYCYFYYQIKKIILAEWMNEWIKSKNQTHKRKRDGENEVGRREWRRRRGGGEATATTTATIVVTTVCQDFSDLFFSFSSLSIGSRNHLLLDEREERERERARMNW